MKYPVTTETLVVVFIILFFAFTSIMLFFSSLSFAFSCGIYHAINCPSGQALLRLSSTTNAHVANISADPSLYPYVLCCDFTPYRADVQLSSGNCSQNHECVIRLSGPINAHVANCSYTFYPYALCIDVRQALFSCHLISAVNSCGGNEACLLTLSSDVNAHAGNCSAYNNTIAYRLCCEVLSSAWSPPSTPSKVMLFTPESNMITITAHTPYRMVVGVKNLGQAPTRVLLKITFTNIQLQGNIYFTERKQFRNETDRRSIEIYLGGGEKKFVPIDMDVPYAGYYNFNVTATVLGSGVTYRGEVVVHVKNPPTGGSASAMPGITLTNIFLCMLLGSVISAVPTRADR